MNRANVIQLLQMLGVERISESSEWIKASCPFAPFPNSGHSKGTDSRPSFGVSIGKQSRYHCFTCDRGGLLPLLVTSLCMLRGHDDLRAREFVTQNEDLSIAPYEDLESSEPLSILSPTVMAKFEIPPPDLPILTARKIHTDTVNKFNLRYDPIEKRLVFPVHDAANNLVGFRGRATTDSDIKYREYSELCPKKQSLKGHGIWYGMEFIPSREKKVILVEGEMDAIKLSQALKLRDGVLAAMGASITEQQIRTIQGLKNPVVLFFDNDEAGATATKKLLTKLKGVKPCIFVVRDYSGCKDPDEIVEKGHIKKALMSMEMVA